MFRRLPDSLPPDAEFPSSLDKLGYFLNESGQIRTIGKPDEPFRYAITNNGRYNDVHREAMRECLRRELRRRVEAIGLCTIPFPQLKWGGPNEAHIPIICTPQASLKRKKRVVVIVGSTSEDLGIWSWRLTLAVDSGLEIGSCLGLASEIKQRARGNEDDEPGIVILNPGQMWYSWNQNKAVTITSWLLARRRSLVHPAAVIDRRWNTVEGNRDCNEHVSFAFRDFLANDEWVAKDAELYIVANYTGTLPLLKFLDGNYPAYPRHIAALSLVCPFEDRSAVTNPELLTFLRTKSRAIIYADAPAGACIGAPYHQSPPNEHGVVTDPPWWPEIASGQVLNHGYSAQAANQEVLLANVYPMVLNWFEEVARTISATGNYENPILEAVAVEPPKSEDDVEEAEDEVGEIERAVEQTSLAEELELLSEDGNTTASVSAASPKL